MSNYLSVDALSEYINLSKSAIYKKTSLNQIPFIKAGGKKLLFKQEAIDEWLDKYSQPTREEIKEKVKSILKKERREYGKLL